jgi:anti-anti-sigma factor
MTLNITSTPDAAERSATVHVAGDLDYGSTDALFDTAARLVRERPTLRDLRLDFSGLTFCDSAGLAVLLQVHRVTSAAGVQLRLDDRPVFLDRILDVTGILDYLQSAPTGVAFERPASTLPDRRQETADESMDGVGK